LTKPLVCAIISTESEVHGMKKKPTKEYKKKTGEELQQWLIFTRKGSRVESGKRYNRQKFKRGE